MSILRLYLRQGWPDAEPGLPWALLDSGGHCLQQGDGTPASWPRAAEVELLLPAGRTLFTQARLPAGRELKPAVLGFALEEQLGNDPAANLYHAGGKLADGSRQVALCEAAPVRRAVAMLRQLGRLVDRIVPEEMLLPLPADGEWTLAAVADGWMARTGLEQAAFVPGQDASLLPLLLPRLAAGGVPERVKVLGAALTLPAGWQQTAAGAHDWRQGRAGGINFASGELAADRRWRTLAPVLKRTGLILGLLLAAQTALQLGQWAWYGWQKQTLSQDIRAAVKPWAPQALPGSSSLPMLRAVDRLRVARGLPARDDMLELLAELARVSGGVQLTALQYEAGRLAFSSSGIDSAQAARWREQLAARQIQLSSTPGGAGAREWVLTREP